MNIKNYILFFLFTTNFAITKGQIIGPNLVQNPSFEQYSQCPWSSSQLDYAKYWFGLSTEYFNVCAPSGGLSVPYNWAGYQYARTGVAYAGLIVYVGPPVSGIQTQQESIKNLLKDSLIKNKRYCVDYYISLAEVTLTYATLLNNNIVFYDSIGTMFSDTVLIDDGYTTPCDNYVKFTKSLNGSVDTLNWSRISGSVIAKGGEKYLRIGKFYPVNWPPNTKAQFYVYVDDVSVCECAYHINLGEDTALCADESLLLNATLPNATYLWQDGSTNATYEVKQPGTYRVTAYIAEYDITTSDTIIITAEDEKICNPPLTIPNFITPNGDNINDNFQIGNADKYDISLQIYNRWGTLIYQTANYKNDFSCSQCADGVYFYLLSAKSKRNGVVKEYKGSLTVFN
ncbi:MAG: gliding motility-associated C-terminal domain-containing protein [Bacteroidales bacterium]